MNAPQITPRLTQINTIWQWLLVWSLMSLGWLSREQLAEIIAENGDGSLVVYDADGNGLLLVPDEISGRVFPRNFQVDLDEKNLWELDLALMTPSCCDAPDGLSHFWGLPKRIGDVLAFLKLRPALTSDPGLVFLARGAFLFDPRFIGGGADRKQTSKAPAGQFRDG